jgi:signal transduction histidine kinase
VTVSPEVLQPFGLVDAPEDPELAAIARLAARICGVPTATVNLLDDVLQHNVATYGFERRSGPVEESFCQHTVRMDTPLYITDARTNPLVSSNPNVTGELGHIVFYAGTQLRTSAGHTVGTLCVFDDVRRELDEGQRAALEDLAAQVVQILDLRAQAAALQASNDELTRSNEDFAAFTGRVAHDLRNPIAAARGFLRLALGPLGEDLTGRARECVVHAEGATERMALLVDGLLAYAGVGARIRREPLDLSAVADDLRNDLQSLLHSTSGRLEHGKLPTVCSDRTLLCQLLQNLVSNGLKYSRPGLAPVVALSGSADHDGWSLSVTDNGRGIPVDERASAFELFARLPGGRDVAGTGIGLATCARIAETLGGSLTVSDAAGGGTTFTLSVREPAG